MTAIYEPSRAIGAKIGRRLTQWRAVRPVDITPPQPILSVSFDDFPASAAEHGLPVLRAAGVRATFYVSAGLAGQDSLFGPMFTAADLEAVCAAGHEIACHSFSHLDCARASPPDVLDECATNAEALARLGTASPPRHMAYPYGETTVAVKRTLAQRFATARGVLPGLNRGRIDALQLRAVSLYGADAHRRVRPWLEAAAAQKAWLILFTHDIAPAPSRFGTTPESLAETLATAKALRFQIMPVGEAADLLMAAAP